MTKEEMEIVRMIHSDMMHTHVRLKWLKVYVNREVSYDIDDDTMDRLGYDNVTTIPVLKEVIKLYLAKKCFTFTNPVLMTLHPTDKDDLVEVSSIKKKMYVLVKEAKSYGSA